MSVLAEKKALYKSITFFYILVLGLYQISDKLYGAGFIAFMNLKGISAIQIGFILSISQFTQSIFDYPSGNIADKIGRKRTGSIGFIIWGFSLITFAFSSSVTLFVIATSIMAIGIAFISGAFQSWYIDELIALDQFEKRNLVLPKVQGAVMAFSIGGALLASYFVEVSLEMPIVSAGIVAIVVGVVSLVTFEDNYGEIKNERIIHGVIRNTMLFISDRKMWVLVSKSITCYFGYCTFIMFWQIYAVKYLELDYSFLGVALILMMVIMSISSYLVGNLSQFLNPYRISLLGIACSVLGLIILSMEISLVHFVIGIVVFESGLGLESAATGVWIHEHIKSENRSSFLSAFSSLEALSGFAITICVGFIIEMFTPKLVWLLAAMGFGVSFVVLYVFIYRFKPNMSEGS